MEIPQIFRGGVVVKNLGTSLSLALAIGSNEAASRNGWFVNPTSGHEYLSTIVAGVEASRLYKSGDYAVMGALSIGNTSGAPIALAGLSNENSVAEVLVGGGLVLEGGILSVGPIVTPVWSLFMAGANLNYAAAPLGTLMVSTGTPPANGVAPAVPVLSYAKDIQRVASWEYGVIPTTYVPASATVILQWSPTTTSTGNVRWGIAFAAVGAGENLSTLTHASVVALTSAASGVSGQLMSESMVLTHAQLDNVAAGNSLIAFVFRLTGDAADSYADAADLVSVRINL